MEVPVSSSQTTRVVTVTVHRREANKVSIQKEEIEHGTEDFPMTGSNQRSL